MKQREKPPLHVQLANERVMHDVAMKTLQSSLDSALERNHLLTKALREALYDGHRYGTDEAAREPNDEELEQYIKAVNT